MDRTDKELLELAAKANWQQELADDEVGLRYSEQDDGILYLHADNQDNNGNDREFVWNPLNDDGDALRLAVKIGIRCGYEKNAPPELGLERECGIAYIAGRFWAESGQDPFAATRRAIVHAAADIGSKMPDVLQPSQSTVTNK